MSDQLELTDQDWEDIRFMAVIYKSDRVNKDFTPDVQVHADRRIDLANRIIANGPRKVKPMAHHVRTTHIQQMLQDALRLAKEAEGVTPSRRSEAFLEGAITQAEHASAELRDELFRVIYPELLRT
jgi:hypothetical protein